MPFAPQLAQQLLPFCWCKNSTPGLTTFPVLLIIVTWCIIIDIYQALLIPSLPLLHTPASMNSRPILNPNLLSSPNMHF